MTDMNFTPEQKTSLEILRSADSKGASVSLVKITNQRIKEQLRDDRESVIEALTKVFSSGS